MTQTQHAQRANDNLPEDIAFSLEYLATGGLGEVVGAADAAATENSPQYIRADLVRKALEPQAAPQTANGGVDDAST